MYVDFNFYDYWFYDDWFKIVWLGGKKFVFWIVLNIEYYEFQLLYNDE